MNPYDDKAPKDEQVRSMFDRIAPHYDRLNHLLSFGVDRMWRRRLVNMVRRDNPAKILDVATGTGDLAVMLARKVPGASIDGVDLSERMTEAAEGKVIKKGLGGRIAMRTADGKNLPFADSSFDTVTIAFGIRNFDDIPAGLAEAARVLRPGGKYYILEFSTPRGRLFGPLFRFYFHRLLPFAGGLVSGDGKAYRYLPGSVDEFPRPEEFIRMLETHGFANCTYRSMTGGICVLYCAERKEVIL